MFLRFGEHGRDEPICCASGQTLLSLSLVYFKDRSTHKWNENSTLNGFSVGHFFGRRDSWLRQDQTKCDRMPRTSGCVCVKGCLFVGLRNGCIQFGSRSAAGKRLRKKIVKQVAGVWCVCVCVRVCEWVVSLVIRMKKVSRCRLDVSISWTAILEAIELRMNSRNRFVSTRKDAPSSSAQSQSKQRTHFDFLIDRLMNCACVYF